MARTTKSTTPLTRQRLLSIIQANPGIHIRRVSLITGLGWNSCQYHLREMGRAGMVVSKKVQGKVCWFDRSGGVFRDKQAAVLLRDSENLRVARAILDDPGCNQLELSVRLGVAASTVHRRVSRMENAGIVTRVAMGRSMHLFPSDELDGMAHRAHITLGQPARHRPGEVDVHYPDPFGTTPPQALHAAAE